MQIQNNVFVVTGGASGLGAATSRLLAAQGGKVVIADVTVDKGQALASELGMATRFVKCDVTSEADGKAAISAALDQAGFAVETLGKGYTPQAPRFAGWMEWGAARKLT